MADTTDNSMAAERLGKPVADQAGTSLLDRLIYFCLTNKLVVTLVALFIIVWGIMVAPFDWEVEAIPRDPVPVDAIPDIGENQQIVFTRWMGRSPQDVEDQVSYPLTVAMLGIPGVKTVRSYSMFGFSTIYIIFKEDVDFYWSRSRVLEQLNSLPAGSLPDSVQPTLGPDATALGQVYWYTLEGHDEAGKPTGGWDLHELRSIQDWYVRYGLLAADGISEVASVGGHVQEYQIDVDPDAMRAHNITLDQVFAAVKMSNIDVGARTIEVNSVEYIIRGLGFIENLADIENTVVSVNNNVPIYVKNVANVATGPALRRGVLDKGGTEAVGGVAVVRYGENPLAAIKNLKGKVAEISPGLPEKVLIDFDQISPAELRAYAAAQGFSAYTGASLSQDTLLKWYRETATDERPSWATLSKVTIVPFYDRTGLIYETLGTLNQALVEEILITIIVIMIMLLHLRSSMVISATLPLAVLLCFIAMKQFGVDANIVALSGIAIAVGTIVDMGVVICENILRHLEHEEDLTKASSVRVVYEATREVGSAVLTAILTTIISFLPVFTMIGAEGKLFRPLAFTKTFALFASVIVALAIVPALAHTMFTFRFKSEVSRQSSLWALVIAGIAVAITWLPMAGSAVCAVGAWHLLLPRLSPRVQNLLTTSTSYVAAFLVAVILTKHWLPLGPSGGFVPNFIVVITPIATLLLTFRLLVVVYPKVLRTLLDHKWKFLAVPLLIVFCGLLIWRGTGDLFKWLPDGLRQSRTYAALAHTFPGLGKEFMPPLDEGSYLYMPTTMPHASVGEAIDVLQKQDMAFNAIPEIDSAVGKIGRADTPLDPAPISMIETVINYKPEYLVDKNGHLLQFRLEADETDLFRDEAGAPVPANDGEPYTVRGKFVRDATGNLVEDRNGMPFRLWRMPLDPDLNEGRQAWQGIENPNDIWEAIVDAGSIPGTTSAPKLQPIAARIVMLQSGMRAPMGLKIKGPDLETIEQVGLELEQLLRQVPSIEPSAVIADRIVGKPYMEIDINRQAAARYGIPIRKVQDVIEVAVGGKRITNTVEGRERYPVRVRYQRELRDSLEALETILVPGIGGQQIPMKELAEIRYVRGPQVIKSEDTFLVGYVLLDKRDGYAEVDVVEDCQRFLQVKIDSGEFSLPAGVSYTFAGSYENQIRASKTLAVVLPLALFIIFLILYLQFRSAPVTLILFSGIAVAWAGGFILIWLYGQPWFMDFDIFGQNVRELFQIKPINLSVAVWVGFLALFGITTDDGVVMATYLRQTVTDDLDSPEAIRDAVVKGGCMRVRACLITTATTILALLPVLTSTGRGADIMLPMAIPVFGGVICEQISMFIVPILYCMYAEHKLRHKGDSSQSAELED
jgi:Cu(I)/Ag(I) efflux system membrane protein CusA/SilA